MNKFIYIIIGLFLSQIALAQGFQDKEFLRYRVHYGFLNAGFATLKVNEVMFEGEPHYHLIGEGSSTGAVRAFFKVDDRYESYMNKKDLTPTRFIRDISEGGHEKHRILTFNHSTRVVTINDLKGKRVTYERFHTPVQDMLSAYYFLRTKSNHDFRTGEFQGVDVFMDGEVYPFKLKVEGRERIKTRFGYINAIKLQPFVQEGRVFKAQESVTMWVSDDLNLIPLRIKAQLVVGSLDMDLHEFENLKHPINFE